MGKSQGVGDDMAPCDTIMDIRVWGQGFQGGLAGVNGEQGEMQFGGASVEGKLS